MQGGIGYGIKYQARCISDVKADTDHISFLAGTLSLKEENEVNLVELWQIPELYGQLNSPQLEKVASLDSHTRKIACVLWWPSGKQEKLISIDEENIFLWNLDCSRKEAQVLCYNGKLI